MADINTLFNQILDELSENRASATQELVSCTQSLIDVLPVAATLRPIQDYSLLQGLLFTQSESQFFRRLTKEADQKQSLAKYCLDNCELGTEVRKFLDQEEPGLRRLFFESGSTIAHCIGLFAKKLSNAQHKRLASIGTPVPTLGSTVVTNNLTGVTALAGLVKELEPVQGRLSLKYFGFLPFSENDAESDWRQEGKRFNLLADDVESCDAVFATCSNFSFLGGPIVGGRDNCLAKRAMYCGAEKWDDHVRRQFYLLFHFEKTVPIVNTYSPEISFEEPQPTCGCVFAPPSVAVGEAISKWRFSHDESNPISSDAFDGTWHDEIRSLAVNGRRSSNKIRIPIEKFDEAISAHRVRIPHKLRTSWIEWLQDSLGINILISLPRACADKALKCIDVEVSRANEVLRTAATGIEFQIENRETAVSELVVHVVSHR